MTGFQPDEAVQRAKLQRLAEEGAALRQWMAMPAYQIVKNAMLEAAGRDNMRWLEASDEEAAKLREAARPYTKFFQVLAARVQAADNAMRTLAQLDLKQEAPPTDVGQGA